MSQIEIQVVVEEEQEEILVVPLSTLEKEEVEVIKQVNKQFYQFKGKKLFIKEQGKQNLYYFGPIPAQTKFNISIQDIWKYTIIIQKNFSSGTVKTQKQRSQMALGELLECLQKIEEDTENQDQISLAYRFKNACTLQNQSEKNVRQFKRELQFALTFYYNSQFHKLDTIENLLQYNHQIQEFISSIFQIQHQDLQKSGQILRQLKQKLKFTHPNCCLNQEGLIIDEKEVTEKIKKIIQNKQIRNTFIRLQNEKNNPKRDQFPLLDQSENIKSSYFSTLQWQNLFNTSINSNTNLISEDRLKNFKFNDLKTEEAINPLTNKNKRQKNFFDDFQFNRNAQNDIESFTEKTKKYSKLLIQHFSLAQQISLILFQITFAILNILIYFKQKLKYQINIIFKINIWIQFQYPLKWELQYNRYRVKYYILRLFHFALVENYRFIKELQNLKIQFYSYQQKFETKRRQNSKQNQKEKYQLAINFEIYTQQKIAIIIYVKRCLKDIMHTQEKSFRAIQALYLSSRTIQILEGKRLKYLQNLQIYELLFIFLSLRLSKNQLSNLKRKVTKEMEEKQQQQEESSSSSEGKTWTHLQRYDNLRTKLIKKCKLNQIQRKNWPRSMKKRLTTKANKYRNY